MNRSDAARYSFPDGSLRLYRYGLTGTQWSLLDWLVRTGAVHAPVAIPYAVPAVELDTTPDAVEDAYRGLAERGLAYPVAAGTPAFQLTPVDAVADVCGCPHPDPIP